jgi:hypothetical protein
MNDKKIMLELKFVSDFSGTIKDGTICKYKFTTSKQKNLPLHTMQGKTSTLNMQWKKCNDV